MGEMERGEPGALWDEQAEEIKQKMGRCLYSELNFARDLSLQLEQGQIIRGQAGAQQKGSNNLFVAHYDSL